MDSPYEILDKIRSFLWKLGLGFWANSLISLLGPTYTKLGFSPHTTNNSFEINFFFYVKLHNFLSETSPYFQNLDGFLAKLWRFISRKLHQKNPSKILFLVPFQVCKFPVNLVSKTPFYEVLKFKYLQKHLAIFKK